MTTEQERDATSYIDAAVSACRFRLILLADAHKRGIHTEEEYKQLRSVVIAEQEDIWDVSLPMFHD